MWSVCSTDGMKMCVHVQRKLAAECAGAGAVFWNNPPPFRHLRFHVNSRKQCLPGTIPDIPMPCWPPCQCDNNFGLNSLIFLLKPTDSAEKCKLKTFDRYYKTACWIKMKHQRQMTSLSSYSVTLAYACQLAQLSVLFNVILLSDCSRMHTLVLKRWEETTTKKYKMNTSKEGHVTWKKNLRTVEEETEKWEARWCVSRATTKTALTSLALNSSRLLKLTYGL